MTCLVLEAKDEQDVSENRDKSAGEEALERGVRRKMLSSQLLAERKPPHTFELRAVKSLDQGGSPGAICTFDVGVPGGGGRVGSAGLPDLHVVAFKADRSDTVWAHTGKA